VAAAVREPALGQSPAARFAGAFTDIGLLLGAAALLYGGYVLVRTVVDLAAPATVTGQVLWRQVWRQASAGSNGRSTPLLHYLAVDDGTDDRTTAWGLPNELVNACADGDTVTIKARRWSRRVVELHLVERGSGDKVRIADPDEQNTEALVAVAMGLPSPGSSRGTAAPATLVTPDEVGRALGAPVSVQGGGAVGPMPVGVSQYHTPDGQLAVVVMVLTGLAGKAAIRSRRGPQALPGIGDEAYAGPSWAIARSGETVVGVTVPGRAIDPRSVHWLLATAVGRLGAGVSPKPS
jgi:hypothetical protein